jgi:hypothetical protein
VKVPHDAEYLEHLPGQVGRPAPVLALEGDLCDLLPRAEAVVRGTAREALRS